MDGCLTCQGQASATSHSQLLSDLRSVSRHITEVVMPMVLLAFGLGILNVCLGFANYASYMPAMQSSETTFSLFQPFSASFRLRCDMLRHAATSPQDRKPTSSTFVDGCGFTIWCRCTGCFQHQRRRRRDSRTKRLVGSQHRKDSQICQISQEQVKQQPEDLIQPILLLFFPHSPSLATYVQ